MRRGDIDRARGLAILLVVFGHLVAREDPRGVSWYEPLRFAVYLFHMPFFFYLSGLVMALTGAARAPLSGWGALAGRRARRLLVPFVLFGVAIVLAKLAASRLVAVDNLPTGVWSGLAALVWQTGASPAGSVWFLVVLFVYAVATPLLLAGRGSWVLVAVAAALFVIPAPPVLYLDRIARYYVFFAAGVLAGEAGTGWLAVVDRRWRAALLGLGGLVVASCLAGYDAAIWPWWLLACGLLAMPALHGLVRRGAPARSGLLLALGRYSLAIYLLNTICIGVAKGVLLTMVGWDGANFLPFAAALMLAGTAGPVLAKRYVLRLVGPLDRMTD